MTHKYDELIRLATAILAHSLAAVAFLLIDIYGVPLYEQWFGAIRKAFGMGMLIRTLFGLFIAVNLVIAIVPVLKVKLFLTLPLVLLTAYVLFPQHPIRGWVYTAEVALLPLAAIYLSRWMHQRLSPRSNRASAP
ncbi:hypothetical protein BK634_28280 [Pseudomonas chlororaphis]|jgi:hypothetical protein|uniref:Uncharacterized protein n=1 Tax=Pseudomonas morbosilactucae TaxID=2938197 RepID=A0A9X1YS08_9PSED|nr:hypothetical protein [Pseudomonas morbosilactucae]MCK9796739.1 hypothetical protein [Pseudomonas morbosilactucae]ROL64070.1 hypothetical protein BK634_28280 [Pseudomonas chlororaphis]